MTRCSVTPAEVRNLQALFPSCRREADQAPERISTLFNRLVRDACLPRIPLHGLRHTNASLALAKGVNPLIVSRRLGHSTVAFTPNVYSHVLPQVDAEAAELIATLSGSESRE